MPKRALLEHRPWLLLSLIAAIAYYFLWNNPIGGVWLIALKGAGVGFLALYALRRTRGVERGLDAALITIALALSAAADMAIELDFVAGGAVFFASHVVAITLYLRNTRAKTRSSQKLAALGLLIGTPVIAYLIAQDVFVALYAIGLGAMAGAAWMSRFPRYRVGIGAVLFVISDMLIFSRASGPGLGEIPNLLIWPLYYAGQFMIATGVVQTLRGEHPAR